MSITRHGSAVQEPDSVCYISYWYVPGGSEYTDAEVRKRYFADVKLAERVVVKYESPPEMAFMVMIQSQA